MNTSTLLESPKVMKHDGDCNQTGDVKESKKLNEYLDVAREPKSYET